VTAPVPGSPRASIVVTAYEEGEQIVTCLSRILEAVTVPCEVLVVYDHPDDSTAAYVEKYAEEDPRVLPTLNTYGRGPANAIRFGIDAASAPVVLVTMADLCDDPWQIDDLVRLVERGVAVAAASRYMTGGQQVGGPKLKGTMSRLAGLTLHHLAGVGTHDATNSFKAYSKPFIESVGIDSAHGFEVGLELVAKARRLRLPIAEVPTVWLDRAAGDSNFQLRRWLPHYLRWYRFAFGGRLTPEQVRARTTTPRTAAPTAQEP
jgi:glycosyltransferase involved in cell wall biosynthesis